MFKNQPLQKMFASSLYMSNKIERNNFLLSVVTEIEDTN